MATVSLSLDEIYNLAKKTLLFNGCDEENASILSNTIMRAERDGSLSHGLFRLPAYTASLKSKKVNGKHWGTVILSLEDPFEPPIRFKNAAKKYGYHIDDAILFKIGEIQKLENLL